MLFATMYKTYSRYMAQNRKDPEEANFQPKGNGKKMVEFSECSFCKLKTKSSRQVTIDDRFVPILE